MKTFVVAALLSMAASPALAFDLQSPDVTTGQSVAKSFVCPQQGGGGISPALAWSGAPTGTQSYAITIHDPDAPAPGGFWHWLVADIPASAAGVPQGADSGGAALPEGTTRLANGTGKPGYIGPCPPPGKPHHYEITVYALPAAKTELPAGAKAGALGAALAKAALAAARIVPIYGQ